MGRASNRKRCSEHRHEMDARRERGAERAESVSAYLDRAFTRVRSLRERDEVTAADLLAWGFLNAASSALAPRSSEEQGIPALDPITAMAQFDLLLEFAEDPDELNDEIVARRNAWLGTLAATPAGLEFLTEVTTALVSACNEDRPEVCTPEQLAEYHRALSAANLAVPAGMAPHEVADAVLTMEFRAPSADYAALDRLRSQVRCGVPELNERTVADALRVALTRSHIDGVDVDEVLTKVPVEVLAMFAVLELAGVDDAELGDVAPYLSCGGPLMVIGGTVAEISAATGDTATAVASLLAVPEAHTPIPEYVFGWARCDADDALGELALSIGGVSRFETADGRRIKFTGATAAALRAQLEHREVELGRPLRDDDFVFGDDADGFFEHVLEVLDEFGVSDAVHAAVHDTGVLPLPFGVAAPPAVALNDELTAAVIDHGGNVAELARAESVIGMMSLASLLAIAMEGDCSVGAELAASLSENPDNIEAEMLRAAVDAGAADTAELADAVTWARRLGSLELAEAVRAAGTARGADATVAFCFLCAAQQQRLASLT